MKNLPTLFCLILIIAACDENAHDIIYQTTEYNQRIYVSDGHITEISKIRGDTVYSATKYLFTDSIITEVYYYPANTESQRTIYKIGENGFAESSYTVPEHYYLDNNDTIFDSRLHYNYDEENHMIRADLEIHFQDSLSSPTLNRIYLSAYYQDTYTNENLVKHIDLTQPFRTCQSTTTYESSGVESKLDILNFTNGIVGKTSANLISSKTLSLPNSVECGTDTGDKTSNFTYTLDSNGYVIQSKEVGPETSSYKDNNTYVSIIIYNYEIHLIE